MRNPILATIAFLASANVALAADLPTLPRLPVQGMAGWTGFYLGANLGGGWSDAKSDFGAGGFPSFASVDNNLKGAIGGVQGGYNWQQGPLVFGVEADLQFSNMKSRIDAPCPPVVCAGLAASFEQKMPWFGTARGRVGYASQSWLIYATGGYAYTRLETNAFASAGGVSADVSRTENRNGWTLGGGIEVAVSRNWTVKAEYLYLDLGTHDGEWTLTGLPTITDSTRLQSNVVRGGVNYRF